MPINFRYDHIFNALIQTSLTKVFNGCLKKKVDFSVLALDLEKLYGLFLKHYFFNARQNTDGGKAANDVSTPKSPISYGA